VQIVQKSKKFRRNEMIIENAFSLFPIQNLEEVNKRVSLRWSLKKYFSLPFSIIISSLRD
jgi:hypothetical protein